MKKIEAITVCVGYADFLAATLPWNMQHFERMVVVTSYDDRETQELCRKLSVECRPTDVMTNDGSSFNKGRCVDYGIGFCTGDEWMVHLDADMWLPPMTRMHLRKADLNEDFIYGIDRGMCPDYESWKKFISHGPVHQHNWNCLVGPPPFPLGARISIPEHSGYIPIGFFQLWHGKHCRRYPMSHGTAERTDVLFPLQWPSRNRQLLGELIAVHLESEPAKMGANWEGRKTMHFGPQHSQSTQASYCP